MQAKIAATRAALVALPGVHTVDTLVRRPPDYADVLLADGEDVPPDTACARVQAEGLAAPEGAFPIPPGAVLLSWVPQANGFAYTIVATIDREPADAGS